MASCEICGNEYRKMLEIRYQGRVIGHGVELGERIFCCANCAQMVGISEKAVNA